MLKLRHKEAQSLAWVGFEPCPSGPRASQVALVVKNLSANAGDTGDIGLIPWSERSPGGGDGNPLQYSCLENFMDRGAWRAIVDGVAKSQTRLSNQHFHTHGLHFLSSRSPWKPVPSSDSPVLMPPVPPLVKLRVSPQPSSSLTFHYHSILVFILSYGKLCTWLLDPHGHWLPCWLLLILLSGIFLRGHPLKRLVTLITVKNSRGKTAVLKSCVRKFGK